MSEYENACTSPTHDHDPHAGEDPPVCHDCKRGLHYDSAVEDYVHDDPDAPGCFLVPARPVGATDCTYPFA